MVPGEPCKADTERWRQTLKNRIVLGNYFLPGDLETRTEAFVEHYNNQRSQESLDNVTPANACFGRAEAIIKQRERIKPQSVTIVLTTDNPTLDLRAGPAWQSTEFTGGGTDSSIAGLASALVENGTSTLTSETSLEAQLVGALSARLELYRQI